MISVSCNIPDLVLIPRIMTGSSLSAHLIPESEYSILSTEFIQVGYEQPMQ